jgi:UDP-glucose 4-epimerase
VAGAGSVCHVPWPADKKAIDIGSFYADSSRFKETVGWTPRVSLRAGLTQTIAYYRAHLEHYVDEPAPTPSSVA